MWLQIAYGAYLGGRLAYSWYRSREERKKLRANGDSLGIPRIDEGAPIPLYFGKVRIRQPIVIHASNARHSAGAMSAISDNAWHNNGDVPVEFLYGYSMSLVYALGIPWKDGTNKLHAVFCGESKMSPKNLNGSYMPSFYSSLSWANTALEAQTGTGAPEQVSYLELRNERELVGGLVTFLDGRSTQEICDATTNEWRNGIGLRFSTGIAPPAYSLAGLGGIFPVQWSGYRGLAIAMLSGPFASTFDAGYRVSGDDYNIGISNDWLLGGSPTVQTYSFEASTYPAAPLFGTGKIGVEANPADVIRRIIEQSYGSLGLANVVDVPSFTLAATTLASEEHGYSRVIESTIDAAALVSEICDQIDAVVYEHPNTGKWVLKLIREDRALEDMPHITINNCVALEEFTAASLAGTVNKIRVTYEDRAKNYAESSESAYTGALVRGQLTSPELVINEPGIKTAALAVAVASRHHAYLSKPLASCRAIVDRSFIDVMPGDQVRVTWPAYGLSGAVFRAAAPSHGTAGEGSIALSLVQDASYVHRQTVSPGGGVTLPPVLAPDP